MQEAHLHARINTLPHPHVITWTVFYLCLLLWRLGGVLGCPLRPQSVTVHVEANTSSLAGSTMQLSPGDYITGGEAYSPPEWGGSLHCFVHLEPLGVSAPNLVVALEHELVHVQCRPGASGVDRAEL